MIVKLLTEHHLEFLSLKGGCRGSSESTHVKMPHCWKSHALAHLSGRSGGITGLHCLSCPLLQYSRLMFQSTRSSKYSKTCLKRLLKRRPNIGFQDRLSLNAGQNIYFQSSLSYHLSSCSRPLFCLFLSGRLRQVLLFLKLRAFRIKINK